MSAAELRKAAETLRERAEDATSGPWRSGGNAVRADCHPIDALALTYSPWSKPVDLDQKRKDAAYIATMHPGVASALVEWLEAVAQTEDDVNDAAPRRLSDETLSMNIAGWDEACALARLINGGAS